MKFIVHYIFIVSILCVLVFSQSCKKFLDAKPDKALVIATSLNDLQALLDNPKVYYQSGGLGEGSADNHYLTNDRFTALDENNRNIYLWQDGIDETGSTWSEQYKTVYSMNLVLEELAKTSPGKENEDKWNNIKGSALFNRSFVFHQLVVTHSLAYDKNSSAQDLGIPLRLNTDFNQPSVRASVQQCYDLITADLKLSITLLPIAGDHVLRPSKNAAYALLARVYLSMGEYNLAGKYADSSLKINNTLIDYNALNPSDPNPIKQFNDEVIYSSHIAIPSVIINTRAHVDSNLYRSYSDNDLRKAIFFGKNVDGTFSFKGSYVGTANMFNGIANDEVYFMRAESYAREGKINEAMNDLNTVLKKRWKSGNFIPFIADTKEDALKLIIGERRKEILFRSLRWMDLKRLNKEPSFTTTLKRIINGKVFELPPNDLRYALPFPRIVIELTGMPQNPR